MNVTIWQSANMALYLSLLLVVGLENIVLAEPGLFNSTSLEFLIVISLFVASYIIIYIIIIIFSRLFFGEIFMC